VMLIIAFSCWILAMFFLVSGHPSMLCPLPWYSQYKYGVPWVVIRESRRSSSSSPSSEWESSYCDWSTVLVRLRIFHVVDVSWILGLGSLSHLSVSLSGFILFDHSSAMIIIRQDVFFEFMKKFINCLWLLSCQMQSCWS
jgi:hypothetical protein